jgi:hypothetical protein
VPCSGGRVYLSRSSRKVPEADGYLADRTWRTVAGTQINPAGRASVAVHCSSRRRPALYSLHLLPIGYAALSLVIYGLLTNPGNVVRCRPGGQPERTRVVKKLKLLLDGDSQDPTPDIIFT